MTETLYLVTILTPDGLRETVEYGLNANCAIGKARRFWPIGAATARKALYGEHDGGATRKNYTLGELMA